ncbi:sensor histidine kinase [Mucilaginibacter sp.]|uniref:sensor histidine kinase n=1 Tax=Mucilaginibacter sp. TaxID=1882438 RepID=UPI003AFFF1CC
MRKPFLIFYFLFSYTLAELVWWSVLLVRAEPKRIGMIAGELAVFIAIFSIGAYFLHKSINSERRLHQQQKNFLLSVTHELKSPLASIKLYLQTIQKRDLDRVQQMNFIGKSLVDIERLNDLVENMLIASRIDNSSYTFPKETFNLSDLVQNIVNRLQINKCDCNQQIISAHVEPDIEIVGDKFALSSMINNLVENAIKYSGPCEVVEVKLKRKEQSVHLMVADHGIGISDAEKPRIFDKFYRVGNEDTRNTKGTGLGLFIVKHVLDKHEATIKVRDNKPSGSIFEVVFA